MQPCKPLLSGIDGVLSHAAEPDLVVLCGLRSSCLMIASEGDEKQHTDQEMQLDSLFRLVVISNEQMKAWHSSRLNDSALISQSRCVR